MRILMALFFVFMASQVVASPYVGRHVQKFLSQDSGAKISVVVSFDSSHRAPQSIVASEAKKAFRKHLEIETQKNTQAFKDLFVVDKPSVQPLWIINGFLAQLSSSQIKKMMKSLPVKSLYWGARPIFQSSYAPSFHTSLTDLSYTYGLEKIGVEKMLQKFPQFTGKGVRVGIIDTGIDADHRDLRGRLRVFKNFSPATHTTPRDEFDHGTHVAGTIAGGQDSGIAIGVAPEAELIVGRIFDRRGESTLELILQSMQWVADPDGDPNTDDYAQVVNGSWSDSEPYAMKEPGDEPFCVVIKNWTQLGIIPVFSAGNTGPSEGSVAVPGACPEAFSVGATEHNDRLMNFSSTGNAQWKSQTFLKPEVTAPGFKIRSASSNGYYRQMSGTSMAAPHVTGAFALLLQAYPNYSPAKIIETMTSSSKDLGPVGRDKDFGWGRVDINQAVEGLAL